MSKFIVSSLSFFLKSEKGAGGSMIGPLLIIFVLMIMIMMML